MPSLLQIADELYAAPLADFTAERDRRAKELKAGDAGLSAQVKALKKPTLAAWVVNLLVRREAGQADQLLAVGDALREAAAALAGEELRALTRQRRQVTAAVTGQARQLAAEEGVRVTEAVAEQVEATLTAAMVDAEAARAVRSGLLLTALSPAGLGRVDLAGAIADPEALGFTASPRAAPARPRPELRVVPDPEPDLGARREEAAAALAAAAEALTEVVAAAAAASPEVQRIDAALLQLQAEIDELRRTLAELEDRAEELEEELDAAEDGAAAAEAEVGRARAERDRAAAALDACP